MRELLFATKNRGKLRELEALLAGAPLRLLTLADVGLDVDVEEDRPSFEGNARKKAEELARASGRWTLADDSGLEVDALGGAPGVHSARYAGEPRSDAANNARLLAALADVAPPRTARFRCVLALASPDGDIAAVADGVCEGEIAFAARGDGGFGYDPLFLVAGLGRTMAELSSDEKNRLSHRARAMAAMAPHLRRLHASEP